MVSVVSAFLSVLLILLCGADASAKCRSLTVDQYVKDVPTFILGRVKNLEIGPIKNDTGARTTAFKIDVIKVIKGNTEQPELNVKYEWFDQKEPFKTFEDNKIYIFAVRKINGVKVEIDSSTCMPDLSESEINKFLNHK